MALKTAAIAVVASLAATSAFAMTVSYDETTDGDISDLRVGSPGSSVFTLQAGTNTIMGSASNDKDDFGIIFADTLEFVGGTFTATNITGSININSSSEPLLGGGVFGGEISGDTTLEFAPGIEAYSVFRVNAGENETIDYAYTFELSEIEAVPLPASGLLLLGGMAGIAVSRRRRSAV